MWPTGYHIVWHSFESAVKKHLYSIFSLLFFETLFLLVKIPNMYKSQQNGIRNSSIPSPSQLAFHGQSYVTYFPSSLTSSSHFEVSFRHSGVSFFFFFKELCWWPGERRGMNGIKERYCGLCCGTVG